MARSAPQDGIARHMSTWVGPLGPQKIARIDKLLALGVRRESVKGPTLDLKMRPSPVTATDLTQQLRQGRRTATEVMEETYDLIEAWNPATNAIVSLMPRAQAIALAREADRSERKGPLHGIPTAVKDLANAKGFRTSHGSPLFEAADPAEADDIMVARLRAAGALIIGKTNTPEFGLGSHTYNPVHGATRNPWDLSKTPGGSSGGAAVALATGMLALADGSDMMGSLRNPAGWTGTYGLRPTWGAVPSEPKGDTFVHQLSTNGPMARTPTDLERLLTVQAGPDPRQPYRVTLLPAESRPLRIAWLVNWDGAYPMEPGILDQCNGALEVLEGLGHEIVPCSPGFASDALWVSWTTLRSWQVAVSLTAHVQTPGDRALLKPEGQWELDRGLAATSTALHAASVARSQWFAQAAHLFERFDALALPTAQCWPFDVTLDWPKEIAGAEMDTYHRWMEVVVPASLIGLPALGMPAGFSDQGLPIGLQLIGPPQSDFSLIACAKAYHEAAPWSERRPVLEP